MTRHCAGPDCLVDLTARRVAIGKGRSCLFCSDACRQRRARITRRVQHTREAVLRCPRCMICNAPMRYGRSGLRYDASTCGDLRCARARRDWFGASPSIERKKLHREGMRRKRAAA